MDKHISLSPCPFCGSKAVYAHSMAYDWVKCGNMNCHNTATISVRSWNTRPIEDELNARIAQLTAERDAWKADAERLVNNCMDTFFAECVHCKAIEYNNIILHAPNCPITLHRELVEKYKESICKAY